MSGHQVGPQQALIEPTGGFLRGALLLVAVAAFAAIAAFAGSASAAVPGTSYGYKTDLGSVNSSFELFDPIATSENGNLFYARGEETTVYDSSEAEIAQFTPVGEVNLFGTVFPTTENVNGVAVSPDGEYVYAKGLESGTWETFNGEYHQPIYKFDSDGGSPPTYTQDPVWKTDTAWPGMYVRGLAIDPSTGNLIVASVGAEGRFQPGIYRVDQATGATLSSFDGSTTARGPFKSPTSIAVAPDGDIYVIENEPNRVEHMGPDGSWKGSLPLNVPTTPGTIRPRGIAVDPQTGDVAILQPASLSAAFEEDVISIFSPTNQLVETVLLPPGIAGEGAEGVAFSADGSRLYVPSREGTARVLIRGTQPGLEAPTVSEVTPTGAKLSGRVATGGESSAAHFEYCLATAPCGEYLTSAGASPWHALPEHGGLADPGEDEISDELSGLLPVTRYLVRSYAINENTQVRNESDAVSFTTGVAAPKAVTEGATGVTGSGATLRGNVNPEGAPTTYFFEYGLTTAYGSQVPIGGSPAGDGRLAHKFSATLDGLTQGQTYHFRIVARNAAGPTFGADATFTTSGTEPIGRAYEEVTPVDQGGGNVNGELGVQVVSGGITYVNTPVSDGAESAPKESRVISFRGDSDWGPELHVDPPFNVRTGLNFGLTSVVSDDGSHALVISNRALAPGGAEGTQVMNLYVKDLRTGAYTFVGKTEGEADIARLVEQARHDVIAAAPDLSWVVFSTAARLLPGLPLGSNTSNQNNIYRWTDAGGLEDVSVIAGPVLTQQYRMSAADMRQVSADGRRVFFQAEDGVYLRENGHTTPISVSTFDGSVQNAELFGCDEAGRYVVFSSGRLNAEAPEGKRSFYRYDVDTETLEFMAMAPTENPAVDFSRVYALSKDASTMYWVVNGGQVVMWRNGEVVTLPAPVEGPPSGGPGRLEISPNGKYAAIVSNRDLYLFDADTHAVSCASCDAGAPTFAASTPTSELGTFEMSGVARKPQWVTDDGAVFFNTPIALVPADVNGMSDVYEYSNGGQRLISPGDDSFEAMLMDISSDGRDVYFLTNQSLVARDTNRSSDIYDARVGGGLAVQNSVPAPPCGGEACQSAGGSPPAAPSAASETADPAGKAKKSAPKKVKKQPKCGAKTKGRAAHHRAAKACHRSAHHKAKGKRAGRNGRSGG